MKRTKQTAAQAANFRMMGCVPRAESRGGWFADREVAEAVEMLTEAERLTLRADEIIFRVAREQGWTNEPSKED